MEQRRDSDLLPPYESRPATPTPPPPPYQIRPDSVGAGSLSKSPIIFYTNPVYEENDETTAGERSDVASNVGERSDVASYVAM